MGKGGGGGWYQILNSGRILSSLFHRGKRQIKTKKPVRGHGIQLDSDGGVVAFSSLARILGECSTIHSPPVLCCCCCCCFVLFSLVA